MYLEILLSTRSFSECIEIENHSVLNVSSHGASPFIVYKFRKMSSNFKVRFYRNIGFTEYFEYFERFVKKKGVMMSTTSPHIKKIREINLQYNKTLSRIL